MKGHLDIKELESWKKEDLQKLASDLKLSTRGTVKELAARIAAVEVELPDEKTAVEEAAGNVKVEIVRRYLDRQINQIKEAGEIFSTDEARAEKLVAAKVAKIIE